MQDGLVVNVVRLSVVSDLQYSSIPFLFSSKFSQSNAMINYIREKLVFEYKIDLSGNWTFLNARKEEYITW